MFGLTIYLRAITRLVSISTIVLPGVNNTECVSSRLFLSRKTFSFSSALISLTLGTINCDEFTLATLLQARMCLLFLHRKCRSSNTRGHAAIKHTDDRLWQLILMAVKNARVKIKEFSLTHSPFLSSFEPFVSPGARVKETCSGERKKRRFDTIGQFVTARRTAASFIDRKSPGLANFNLPFYISDNRI